VKIELSTNLAAERESGRHEPLVSQERFDRVQDVLVNQHGAGTRERVHHYPLKGLLWCSNCRTRFYLDTVKNRRGIVYSYFLCSGKAGKHCQTPRMPVAKIETAVAAHYATLNVPPSTAAELQAAVDKALREKGSLSASLRRNLEAEHDCLVSQLDHLLDLVDNPEWPQDRLEVKMRRLRDELAVIDERLTEVGDAKVERAGEAIAMLLQLLDDPRRLLRSEIRGGRWACQSQTAPSLNGTCTMPDSKTMTLWRPCGPAELELVRESGWTAWPPRLPDQPIFYPFLNEETTRRRSPATGTRPGTVSGT
jgi:hypothetical protein